MSEMRSEVVCEMEIRIKTPAEVAETIARRRSAERGLLGNQALLLITAVCMISAYVYWPIAVMGVVLLAADFLFFVVHRHGILTEDEAARPRLETPADFERVSETFAEAGMPEPTMSDFESAAGLSERSWGNDLRYRDLVQMYHGGIVADIGCGDGRLCWKYKICEPASYIGVDTGRGLIQSLMDQTQGRAQGVVAVAETTTLPSNSVDFVVCSECFEHLPNPAAALCEFVRIVKPNGRICIQSPSAYAVRNLNLFHVLNTFLGWVAPSVLQRKMVHANTFIHAYTYHWDFTLADFRQYCRPLPVRMLQFSTATYRFNPRGGWLHRLAYRLAKLPVIQCIWWNMTVVLQKTPATSASA